MPIDVAGLWHCSDSLVLKGEKIVERLEEAIWKLEYGHELHRTLYSGVRNGES